MNPARNSGADGSGSVVTPASVVVPRITSGGAERRVIWILALFLGFLVVAMIRGQWIQPREEPWGSPELQEARRRLEAEPRNEALKTEIRVRDRELRETYFRGLERNRTGAVLLLATAAGLVHLVHRTRIPVPPRPQEVRVEAREREPRWSRWVTAGAGGGTLLVLAMVGLAIPSRPGPAKLAVAKVAVGPAQADRGPSTQVGPVESIVGWPRFRGPDGSGIAGGETGERGIPLAWDVASGRGILWRTELGLAGYSSPIVWGDRIFLTSGDKQQRLVSCHDAGTGQLRWARPVVSAATDVEPPDQSGPAASTPATDGKRVFAVFAAGELGALDFEGKLVWSRRLDFKENGYGHASSLIVWRDRLIVQADQGQPEDGKSVLQAFDTATGNPVWAAKRPVGGSWATPVVTEAAGRAQLITAGDPFLMAHDPGSGAELWRARVLGGELAPSPIRAGAFILAVSPGHAMVAVKPDGRGDVTASHVAWKLENEVPDVPSPVASAELFFTANTEGHVFCREISTGAKVWEHAYEMEIQASPLRVGSRIYLLGQPGKVVVLEAAREFKELAAFDMGEELYASPACAAGRLYVRGKRHLFGIGDASPATSQVVHAR